MYPLGRSCRWCSRRRRTRQKVYGELRVSTAIMVYLLLFQWYIPHRLPHGLQQGPDEGHHERNIGTCGSRTEC